MGLSDEIIVPPSLPRLLCSALVGVAGMCLGMFMIVGPGWFFNGAVTAFAALGAGFVVLAAIVGRPSVEISREGFTFRTLAGAATRRWDDVASPFETFKVGWNMGVGYKLTEEARARLGVKPNKLLSGYDGALGGALSKSPDELAALLNERWNERRATPFAGAPRGEGTT